MSAAYPAVLREEHKNKQDFAKGKILFVFAGGAADMAEKIRKKQVFFSDFFVIIGKRISYGNFSINYIFIIMPCRMRR